MSHLTELAIDARQTPQWAEYMKSLDWIVEKVGNTNVYVRIVKPFKHSLIKIQHSKEQPDFARIDEIAKKYNALFVMYEPYVISYDEQLLTKNGYRKSKMKSAFTSTVLIDLEQTEEKLLKSFSENARRNIKKAQNNKLTVKHIHTKDQYDMKEFEKFYHLYQTLGKTKGFYVLPYDECVQKLHAFNNNSILSFAYAPDEPEPIAVVWYLHYDRTFVYNHTGITQKGYDLQANALLVWEGLKEGQKLGAKVFDFESIYDPRYPSENKKWIGYSNFKQKFHGETIFYPQAWIKIYNLPYKIIYLCSTALFS